MPAQGGNWRIKLPDNDRTCIDVQVAKGSAIDQAAECTELRRQIDIVEADITLVNKRFEESQSMLSYIHIYFCKKVEILMWCDVVAGGAAAVEALRAELALAKEQACISNAAALKAAEELRAEQAARLRSEEKIAEMAVELRDAAGRYELLEKENQTKAADLKKAMDSAKEMRS